MGIQIWASCRLWIRDSPFVPRYMFDMVGCVCGNDDESQVKEATKEQILPSSFAVHNWAHDLVLYFTYPVSWIGVLYVIVIHGNVQSIRFPAILEGVLDDQQIALPHVSRP